MRSSRQHNNIDPAPRSSLACRALKADALPLVLFKHERMEQVAVLVDFHARMGSRLDGFASGRFDQRFARSEALGCSARCGSALLRYGATGRHIASSTK